MKKIVLAISLLLLTSFFYFKSPLSANAITVVHKDMGYISVNSSASKEVLPDTASIYFNVETSAKDSKSAVDKNKEITSSLILALKPILALDKSDSIQTKNFILRPNYSYDKNGKKTFQNYVASNIIYVKTKNIDNVSKLIDTAVANNATSVSDLCFSIENEKQYSGELAKEAINKAKIIAGFTANTLNQKLSGVKSISVNISSQNNFEPRYASMKSNPKSQQYLKDASVQYGKIKLQAYVRAEFYVK